MLEGKDLSTLAIQRRLKYICFMVQFFNTNAALSVFDVVLMAQKQLSGWHVSKDDMTAVARALD